MVYMVTTMNKCREENMLTKKINNNFISTARTRTLCIDMRLSLYDAEAGVEGALVFPSNGLSISKENNKHGCAAHKTVFSGLSLIRKSLVHKCNLAEHYIASV